MGERLHSVSTGRSTRHRREWRRVRGGGQRRQRLRWGARTETVAEVREGETVTAATRHQGGLLMKNMWLLATLLGFWPGTAVAQSTDELVNDGKNTENVTTQSMGYDRKSYSPLKQITTANITRLVPIWSTSLMNDMGELAAPAIYNG